ncbi:Hypothetical predicted protein [Cloeon dipterum]|uniref:Exosome RNA helicase MTR4 n=1 Tax=Cloeon dipterum TaxID=197152 RepID=A0A8S1CTW4_9INSE|nr:Hypothetical predicted protein [Cloeon dipterum]
MADLDEMFSVFDEDAEAAGAKSTDAALIDVEKVHISKRAFGDEGSSASTDHSAKKPKSDLESPEIEDTKWADMIPRMRVHTVETLEACTHEVAIPPNMKYEPLKPPIGKPAREYPFTLDPFQKEAILCLDNDQSVLVSAHTSAGKTVVAEYSIAKSLQNNQRVIYTTPIKALSNQKYREFHEEFKDVGLITGDVTINPTASCLIMTTEILRSMLYRGSEVSREVGWVIFDEIHYMRDKERGVVWEETLILLADNVRFVFLSATIPNARQFAEWVAYLHKQPCHVVYTDYRPTPLQHFIYPAGGDGIHLVVSENGQFREDNFNAAMVVLQNAGDASKGDRNMKGRKGGQQGESNCFRLVKMIMERSYAPVIVFSFSKKECEAYALQMSRLDFNTVDEKLAVDEVFNNAMDVLSEEDKNLPQVQNVLPLLRRGIGIHHGGLLPILKECIEILFSIGLIKALFATETFAMGLNMPARTVLFSGLRKFDGRDMRFITSGEYIQMSGRAGRRGLDEKGIVILIMDEKVSGAEAKEVLQGRADPINSAFHLTYNMVLNLLRVEEINPEYMLERSFYQFQNQSSIPHIIEKVKTCDETLKEIEIPRESEISSYYKLREHLNQMGEQFQKYLTEPKYIVPFLQPGRLVKIKNRQHEFDWGVVVNFSRKRVEDKRKKAANPLNEPDYEVDVLLHVEKPPVSASDEPIPAKEGTIGHMEVVPVLLCVIQKISSVRLKLSKNLKNSASRNDILKDIEKVKTEFSNGVPLLDAIKDMKIKDEAFNKLVNNIEMFEKRLFEHPLNKDPELEILYNKYLEKIKAEEEFKVAKKELKAAKSLLQMEELKCRKRVLRRLEYCNAADVIELKGRVACELSSADELLLTEMIFHGMFGELTPPQCVALLSCFVCDEKSNESSQMAEELTGPLRKMQELAKRIALVSKEAKLDIDEEQYVEQFKPYLMDVTLAWCKGASFAQICKMTDIFEGSIIRCMRRLEEALRQCVQAAKTIGNAELEAKFTEGIRLLKRDIVFAASLYL